VSVDAGINPKVVSERIGHSSVAFTMQTYVQRSTDLERDATAAAKVAGLILGNRGAKATGTDAEGDDQDQEDTAAA
jgi:hypothetical protein